MARNVIILGAGASRAYGAPVMEDFLDQALDLFRTKRDLNKRDSFERVFAALSALQAVHSKAQLNLINIESVFTAFEMANLLGRLPTFSEAQLAGLVDDLRWLIVVTLEETMTHPHRNPSAYSLGVDLHRFLEILRDDRDASGKANTTILTFNYDMLIDYAAAVRGIPIDYGFDAQKGPKPLKLLKLHGSLNWLSSPQGTIESWFLQDFEHENGFQGNSGLRKLSIGQNLHKYKKSSYSNNPKSHVPVIVPPSWNKADSHKAISSVWSAAAQELSEASAIFVVGYSLPDTDTFFRQLYALGTVGPTMLEKFWVYNPDGSREQHFKSMLGPGAMDRFKFIPERFEESLKGLLEAILKRPLTHEELEIRPTENGRPSRVTI